MVDLALSTYWHPSDGWVATDEEAYEIDQRNNAGNPAAGGGGHDVAHRSSAYGEATSLGARQLFRHMGMTDDPLDPNPSTDAVVFFDLGSGAGRLVAQVNECIIYRSNKRMDGWI